MLQSLKVRCYNYRHASRLPLQHLGFCTREGMQRTEVVQVDYLDVSVLTSQHTIFLKCVCLSDGSMRLAMTTFNASQPRAW